MDIVIIASLIIAGLILFIIEVFLLPGISIAGIISAICLFIFISSQIVNCQLSIVNCLLLTSLPGRRWQGR